MTKDKFEDAYRDLEVPIRNIAQMATAAYWLAWYLLDGESPNTDGGQVTITLSTQRHEALLFAIQKASDMATDFDRAYLKMGVDPSAKEGA